jgi:hypothetical protein
MLAAYSVDSKDFKPQSSLIDGGRLTSKSNPEILQLFLQITMKPTLDISVFRKK